MMRSNTGHRLGSILLAAIMATIFAACQPESRETIQEEVSFEVPQFNSDSAFSFIEDQVNLGPRVPNTKPHEEGAKFIVKKLKSWGYQPEVIPFESYAYNGTRMYLKNIFCTIRPNARRRVLLSAHWDTRAIADKDTVRVNEPIDGANDGASGVAVILEIARILASQELQPDIGVDLLLFDGEDQGAPINFEGSFSDRFTGDSDYCLGSYYWANNKHETNYSAYYGILLDMVGGQNARFYQEQYSMQVAPSLVRRIWQNAAKLGHGNTFVPLNGGYVYDDHVPVIKYGKIQMIDIIEYDPSTPSNFGKYHHRHDDNMDIISKKTLQAVGETVLYTLFQEGK